jgi:hypothetical protein
LRGRQVPFGAQLLAVVDTWAALTRPRPHRPALADRDTVAVLRREATAGRLSGKLVDTLERMAAGGRPSIPPEAHAEGHERGAAANGEPGRAHSLLAGSPVVVRQVTRGLALCL